MFETRLHLISENDALNKRKLWEGFLQWANRFSALDSDNIARLQFENSHFTANTFIEQTVSGFISSGDSGLVGNDSGTLIALSAGGSSLEISGSYWMTWSVDARTDDSRFAAAVPFVGDKLVGCAQDFKAEMGWFGNSLGTGSVAHGATLTGFDWILKESDKYETTTEEWSEYGKRGKSRRVMSDSTSKRDNEFQGKIGNEKGSVFYHLCGSGAVSLGRNTGNVGVVVYAQPGKKIRVSRATMVLRKRNR